MSAPECGVPTKKDGQPCRRPRYYPCKDHSIGQYPASRLRSNTTPTERPDEDELRRYRDRNWQRQEGQVLIKLLGSPKARQLRGLKDCEDLAKVARYLDQAARLEPGPLLDQVEARCGPATASPIRTLTEKLIQRLTGINSLKDVAKALRFAGIWHCAVAGMLETCPCLNHVHQQATKSLRSDGLGNLDRLGIAPEV